MTYQVLARKYRPQTFDEVVGQDAVVKTLHRALDGGRVAHAFLFTGSRGVGKTTLARILAKCLMCEQGPTSKPCGVCSQCTSIAAGTSVDVVEIDGASNTGVDDVRELRELARFLPQSGRWKIFIIDEVHMLSTSAFNALLKTLEEPPAHVKFVFATTEPHKIPVTILSRCQRYDFKRIPTTTIIARLQDVLAAENVKLDPRGLDLIARAAEGGMRDALSLTDQVLSFAGETATPEVVAEALGIIDRRSIVRLVEACIGKDARAAFAVVEEAFARGHDLKQLAQRVAEEFRHLAVASSAGSVQGLVDLADEDIAAIDARAREIDGRDVVRMFSLALEGTDAVAEADDPRLAVELVVLKMTGRPPIGDALAISEALVRLEALAKGKPVPPLSPRPPGGPSPRDVVTAALSSSSSGGRTSPDAARSPTAGESAASPPAPSSRAVAPSTPGASFPASSSSRTAPAEAVQPPLPADAEDPPMVAELTPDAPRDAANDSADVEADDPRPLQAARLRLAAQPPPPAAVEAVPDVEAADDDDDAEDPAAALPLLGVDPRWKQFVDVLATSMRPLAMHLDHAHVRGVGEKNGVLVVEVSFAREYNEQQASVALADPRVLAALAPFGANARLAVVKPAGPPPSPSISEAREAALAAARAALEEHARAHPVVTKAVAMFGGEVRAVRTR